jgi:hypothetical protein
MEKPEKKEGNLLGRIDELGPKKVPLYPPIQENQQDHIPAPSEDVENHRWLD